MKGFSVILLLTCLSSLVHAKDTVLLSGFDPFGGVSVNNSWVIAEQVASVVEQSRSDVEVVTCLLPTSYQRSIPALEKCLNALEEKPNLVVSLGAGPCTVKWETRAHNRDNDKGPDNDGVSRKKQEIIAGAPAELGLRLNYGALFCALTDSEKKLTQISTDPENFVCNHTAYRFASAHPELLYGFVHVPGVACERKSPGITASSVQLISKMILTQLDARATTTSRLEWPSELNSARLPTAKGDVRAWGKLATEECEQDLLARWKSAFKLFE